MIHAFRSLLQRPWYSAAIVGVTATAFALLTAVFAVVDGVLFRPLGYPAESQLVSVGFSASRSRSGTEVGSGDIDAWAKASPNVAFTGTRVQGYQDAGDGINRPSLARALVQANFFDVIGVRPAIGAFTPEDFTAPSFSMKIEPRILTDEVFRSQYGSDPSVIGRTVMLDPMLGRGYRVVGVMPRGFVFPTDLWPVGYLAPYVPSPQMKGIAELYEVIGRLPADASRVSMNVLESRVLAAQLAHNDPSNKEPIDRISVAPLDRSIGAKTRPLFEALLAFALLIVAIATLNASSLMAARAIDRLQELAVRRALGATTTDLGRLLFSESMALMAFGGVLGLATAAPMLRIVLRLLPEDLVLLRPAAIDWRVGIFAALVALALAGLATVWPMKRALGSRLGAVAPGRGTTEPVRSFPRRFVIAAQVATSLVLTVAGSLLVSSLLTVYAQIPPIHTRSTLAVTAHFAGRLESGPDRLLPQLAPRVQLVLDRLKAIPGVQSVAATAGEVLDGGSPPAPFNRPATTQAQRIWADLHAVTSDYYRTVQPTLIAGRLPTDAELAQDAPVLVVGEGVAHAFWPTPRLSDRPSRITGPRQSSP